jgi:hypothetical protein
MGIYTCQTSRFENVNTNGNEVMSRMRIDFTKTEKEFQLMTEARTQGNGSNSCDKVNLDDFTTFWQ